MKLSVSLEKNIHYAQEIFPVQKSFDFITRNLRLGNRNAWFLGINGMCKTDVLQEIFSDLQNPLYLDSPDIDDIQTFLASKIGYAQAQLVDDWQEILRFVLSGPSLLLIDGFDRAVILDTRSYPARSIAEPDTERVTSGSRDGFVETMLFNANLIRRRIRNPKLTFELVSVGSDSRTDIAVSYIDGYVDRQFLHKLLTFLNQLQVTSLTMGAKSLEELLVPKKWYHPLPGIRQTERPDVACSHLTEGNILIITDNSPTVLILPCTIFQFTQSAEDYYKSPSVGTYSRLLRFCCFFISLFLLPLFLLIGAYYPHTALRLSLFPSETVGPIRLFFYVLFAEFILDLYQYSSSHSPGPYSASLSIVGGLIISDIAIQLNWASLEVIFYAAATVLASMSIPSIDFAEGIRSFRIFLILTTGLAGIYGFLAGIALIFWSCLTTPTFADKSYFWPVHPWNREAFATLLFRRPTFKAQPDHVWKRERKKKDTL